MWLFTFEPKAIVRSALLADLLGSFLASILLFVGEQLGFGTYTYHVDIHRGILQADFWKSFVLHLAFGFLAAGIGLFVVLLYVIPVMVVLRKFRLGGPLMALSVSVLPGVLISALESMPGLSLLFIGFSLTVALVFCGLAYRRLTGRGDR